MTTSQVRIWIAEEKEYLSTLNFHELECIRKVVEKEIAWHYDNLSSSYELTPSSFRKRILTLKEIKKCINNIKIKDMLNLFLDRITLEIIHNNTIRLAEKVTE